VASSKPASPVPEARKPETRKPEARKPEARAAKPQAGARTGLTRARVTADEAGMRLDRWFHLHYPQLTHAHLNKLLRTGQVRVDGRRAKGNARLEADQEVKVPPLDLASRGPERATRQGRSPRRSARPSPTW
jgi:23S rRNA-/tRNA-specific pseudouridylate synthase